MNTLLKRGWRSDLLWTRGPLNWKVTLRIPLWADTRALLVSQYWSRETLDSYTRERIIDLMRYAKRVALWRDIYAQNNIDPDHVLEGNFVNMPITSKRNFPKDNISYWTDPDLLHSGFSDHTSGSTGRPFDFYVDRAWELRSFAVCERMVATAAGGTRPPVIALRAREKLGFLTHNQHLFFMKNYNTVKFRLPALVEFVKSLKSEVVFYGFPSACIELARRARESNVLLPIRAIIATGESIRSSERKTIEQDLHTKFFTTYATRELGWLGFECEERAMHLNEEWAYVEIVDEQGNPAPFGTEGFVVATVFDSRIMPMIRYRNGDKGKISDEPCACGRTLRTIQVTGREIEFIHFDDGRTVSLLDFASVFDWHSESVKQFQIVQQEQYTFSVRVMAGERFERDKKDLELRLIRLLHPAAVITWEIVEEIPASKSGKALYFVGYKQSSTKHVEEI